jgi:hypothetical protein
MSEMAVLDLPGLFGIFNHVLNTSWIFNPKNITNGGLQIQKS